MAYRHDGQALCGTRRRFEIRAEIPPQQSFPDLREVQRYFPEAYRAEGRRKNPAAFWRRGQRDRSWSQEKGSRRAGSCGCDRRIQGISHDLFRTRARNGKGRAVVRGVFAGETIGWRTHGKAVALQLQRICAEKNERAAKAEELQGC